MDRLRLDEYEQLRKELDRLRREIRQAERNAERCKEGVEISDVATGSSPEFPYIQSRIKVQSIDRRKYDAYMEKLKRREQEYQDRILQLEDWLEAITDPLLYRIFKLKLKNGMSDKSIGEELGYSRSRITQMINEHLKD